MAAKAIQGTLLIRLGAEPEGINQWLGMLPGRSALLFPGTPNEALGPSPTPPDQIVVLDGTWRQVRRMFRRLPALWSLPRITLGEKLNPPIRLRSACRDDQRSTLEAISDALEILEGPETGESLRRLHQEFVERSLMARGSWTFHGMKQTLSGLALDRGSRTTDDLSRNRPGDPLDDKT